MRTSYHLIYLERFELGSAYPAIMDRVCELMSQPPPKGQTELVVDATGIGRPVVDMLEQRKPGGRWPVPITIHGGDTVERTGYSLRVPKRDLVGGLQVLLQSQRLSEDQSRDRAR
jgi:hypothetical protein